MQGRRLAFVFGLVFASGLSSLSFAADAPPAGASKPMYGAWGFDVAGADLDVRPGDDFFRYANGTWLATAKIPPDKPAWTLRLEMTDRTEARLRQILEESAAVVSREPGTLQGKAGAFYKSFMDEARIEQQGIEPLAADLQLVRRARTREELAALMGRANFDFQPTLFATYVMVDLKDPNRYAVYLTQSGLGLPDRDYYLKPEFAATRTAYQAYVAKLLGLVGWPDPDARAKDVVEFEAGVARESWSRVQQRDVVAAYNPMTVTDLQKLAPTFAWHEYFAAAGLGDVERVIVNEKGAFAKIAAVYGRTPAATIRAWQAFHIADNAAPYLSKSFTDAHFELHDRLLSGQQQQRARWKRGVTAVAGGDFLVGDRFGTFGTLGFGVGQLYTARYFGPDAKAKIEELVGNLKAACRVRIEKLDWMSPATKKEALRKLDTYTIKVGYPDNPRDYSKVVILSDDLLGNVRRAAEADWAFDTGRLPGPVDRSSWQMTPQTNDAYNGELRDIVFPAGILQAPMFDVNADPAVNYGAIGAVIGHELIHGFDDEGRKIDADGALRDWWTKQDAQKFQARAKALGAQYSAFEPIPGVHVNGQLTMGENIADLGGLAVALDAYRASLKGAPAPVLDGYTGDQRVLLGWAQAWRGKVTDDFVRKQVVTDPHSPRQFRVIGPTRNIDAWYESFGVKAGDAMFLPPDKRVRIW
ncbi:MAG: peptidase M13 [Gammaproteobacteria bacterium]|nr:peptidase M13 [Gammaproteobacteria bacterium]